MGEKYNWNDLQNATKGRASPRLIKCKEVFLIAAIFVKLGVILAPKINHRAFYLNLF